MVSVGEKVKEEYLVYPGKNIERLSPALSSPRTVYPSRMANLPAKVEDRISSLHAFYMRGTRVSEETPGVRVTTGSCALVR